MKTKRYGVNVRETTFQPRIKQRNLQISSSPQGLQQGWNTTPCEKLLIAPIQKSCMCKINCSYPNIIKIYIKQNNKHKDKPMTPIPDLVQAHETCGGVKQVFRFTLYLLFEVVYHIYQYPFFFSDMTYFHLVTHRRLQGQL